MESSGSMELGMGNLTITPAMDLDETDSLLEGEGVQPPELASN